MSDYGDDYSDYGEEWFYVEEEYMAADDLAEHAVASPPPTAYGDEDGLPDWDRFDYFNDLEYASDGYDNAKFEVHNVKDAKTGQKRKRSVRNSHSKKTGSTQQANIQADTSLLEHSPIVWRAQNDRETKAQLLDDNAQSYAVLKNWREKVKDTPQWARGSPPQSPSIRPSRPGKGKVASAPEPVSPPSDIVGPETVDEEEEEEDMGISQDVLMAALQRQLATAGGPLSGMDPQQLLEFAMRMATDKDAGDDIAGEMAEAMLEGDEEEDDADAEENLLSWVAQQRNANKESTEEVPKSPEVSRNSKRPPTPPSSEANRSVRASRTSTKAAESNKKSATSSLKRKADDDSEGESSAKVTKKRVTRSFDAPTAASQAKAAPAKTKGAPAKTTRSTRAKRP
ncbi:uncharacterized protein K460DRAFT_371354 [Cucurbitaria berberidis CBS 394.84]|uniref:Uncharacterized protein n=1 Tax=Cucurbitaria berberidis CBS 394.84 TaxID=1168544 RepID=A0A9P4G6W0_9PLEO|nr:uncharacterized protein K460DRAFT_371354 [Cucurbitaria berberidis CBS 394.84]KAF1840138.1 hypothetical protein K460DRAFT_371354 [Cucurbitaria berberidis CBS 394.84]